MGTGVLVVEDNDLLRDMTAYALESHGFAVQVSNGFGVQSAAEQLQPAVILLDLCLPGADGVAIYHQLKASTRTSDIPVVAMTGSMPTDGLGVDDVLAKPFTVLMLLHKVRKWAKKAG
jgi:two-component system, OmpR family, alkaline phosphatase synthesis response regulator PhoP